MIIYTLTDPAEPGVIRYVGKTAYTVEKRLSQHLSGAGKGAGRTHRENWIRKVLASGRIPTGQVIAFAASDPEANVLERHYIAFFRSIGMPLTNTTDGGDGVNGHRHTEESKRRMSEAQRGKKHGPCPEERKAKISAAQKGKPRKRPTEEERARHKEAMNRPETIAKQRAAHLGRVHTEETKRKIGLAGVGRKCPKSPETRRKISESLIGRTLSDEIKRKQQEAYLRPEVKERMAARKPGGKFTIGHHPSPETIAKSKETRRRKKELEAQPVAAGVH